MNNNKLLIDSGLDVLVKDGFKSLLGLKVAILANQASVDKNINNIVDLSKAHGVDLVKIFAPEHGFSGSMQDMEHVAANRHVKYDVPIISLYGDHKASLTLQAKELEGIDVLVADLQDVGSRYYTFHCTIAWAMAACAKTKTKLLIIDRPNPINAHDFEGNLVQKAHFSFVGAYPLPNRHGFTMGELVLYVKDVLQPDLDCEVVWMKNYDRHSFLDELALPFISPSVNMPSVNAALVYPGQCLIEGTNLSEGRGTCTPFELVGAPYIGDAYKFKDRIDQLDQPGVKTRACTFKPMFQKHANKLCHGIAIHVVDRKLFKPLRFSLGLIKVAMTYPGFDWRREPYEFEKDRLAIDLLLGDDRLRKMLEDKASLSEIFAKLALEEEKFLHTRTQYLHYLGCA